MSTIREFYIEKEKRELINTISSAKYVSEEQKEVMIDVLEDADADMKAAREKKDRERKRAAASRQTDAYRGIEKSRPTKDKAPLHPESVTKEDWASERKAAADKTQDPHRLQAKKAERKRKQDAEHRDEVRKKREKISQDDRDWAADRAAAAQAAG